VSGISFADAPAAVRPDLVAATRRAWQRLARPGSWWTGAERVAIAAQVRAAGDCALCRERKQALSPESGSGTHAGTHALPAAAVEVVHRVTTDPARLSRGWFERQSEDGLSDGHYVELVGVVVTVVSIDAFCRGLGLAPRALPEPEPGEPDGRRPAAARPDGAWLPMIPANGARGPEADLWGSASGNVVRALSLVPDEVRTLKDLSAAYYLPMEDVPNPGAGGGRAIDRAQTELVAGRVSALNECFY